MSSEQTFLKKLVQFKEAGPYLGSCEGWLQNAGYLPYDVCIPIILPKGKWRTKLIVKHFHGAGHACHRDKSHADKSVDQILDSSRSRRNSRLGKGMQWVRETQVRSRWANHGATTGYKSATCTSSIRHVSVESQVTQAHCVCHIGKYREHMKRSLGLEIC